MLGILSSVDSHRPVSQNTRRQPSLCHSRSQRMPLAPGLKTRDSEHKVGNGEMMENERISVSSTLEYQEVYIFSCAQRSDYDRFGKVSKSVSESLQKNEFFMNFCLPVYASVARQCAWVK